MAQRVIPTLSFGTMQECETVCVTPLHSDSTESTFHIVVKTEVPLHYHATHNEQVVVLKGEAEMILADSTFRIGPGDLIIIPEGTPHAVLPMADGKELEVLSVQTPFFNGLDRVLINSDKKY